MAKKRSGKVASKFILLVLIGLIIFISKKENFDKVINFIELKQILKTEFKIEKSIDLDIEMEKINYKGENIFLWGNNRLVSLDLAGNKNWERQYGLDQAKLIFGQEKIYVGQMSTGEIHKINYKGEIENKFKLNKEIFNFFEEFPYIVGHIKETGGEALEIINDEGDIITRLDVKDEIILTASINNKNKDLALASLNIKGENFKSQIQSYNLAGEFLWTLYMDGEILIYLNYDKQDNLVAMSDRNIYQINNGNILWKKPFQNIKNIYMGDKAIYLLYQNVLESLLLDGRLDSRKLLQEDYEKILAFKDYILLHGENNISGFKGDKERLKYIGDGTIIDLVKGGDRLIILYKDKLDIISLR